MGKSLRQGVMAVVLALFAASAQASGGPPMMTDDPNTPGDGRIELNVAGSFVRTNASAINQLPLVDVNYGIGERAQLKFEIPWQFGSQSGTVRRDGIGRSLLGAKWRFYEDGAWRASVYPQIESGGLTRNGVADGGTSYLLPVEFEYVFGDSDLNFELGRWQRSATQVNSWIGGCALTHTLHQGLEVISELHDEAARAAGNELAFNLGTRWEMSDDYTLLFSAGRDLHNTLTHSYVRRLYLGVQTVY